MSKPFVLHVDDDVMFHVLIRGMLRDHAEVQSVFSVEEAMRFLENRQPDMILTDLMMPGRPGIDLIQYCEEETALCDIPVVAVSAIGDPDFIPELRHLKVDDYLSKPFGRMELVQIVEQLTHQATVDHR